MFENLLYQNAASLIGDDIRGGTLPQALLFAGPAMSGKLTAALETARVLSCSANPKGMWQCTCPSCLKHKSLVSPELLLAGSRDCTLEIAAAAKTLKTAAQNNASYIAAARYLFVRSVRKLTARFNQVLWGGDEKVSKIAAITSVIDEYLEELDPLRPLQEADALEKTLENLCAQCVKLESSFMYDSIPVSQIRKASSWARLSASEGKRVLIFEHADRMQDSVKNALLKILEEPPADAFFILTAERKNAVLPTILSRVRTYSFNERSAERQSEVVRRIFHEDGFDSIGTYLNGFLPASVEDIEREARSFTDSLRHNDVPDIDALVKRLKNFEPRIMLSLFFDGVLQALPRNTAAEGPQTADAASIAYRTRIGEALRRSYEYIRVYNQSPVSALESLAYAFLEESFSDCAS
ncbi:DNA polymerase III [Treponema sp. HNW]|uniref:DNA polymerase III n=1 Tax=Treponema sp. HNW TaxID=3116654 RepID=UPI003D0CA5AC